MWERTKQEKKRKRSKLATEFEREVSSTHLVRMYTFRIVKRVRKVAMSRRERIVAHDITDASFLLPVFPRKVFVAVVVITFFDELLDDVHDFVFRNVSLLSEENQQPMLGRRTGSSSKKHTANHDVWENLAES